MKERPILFSGPMVRAIQAGRKTQTRRVIKNPDDGVSTTIDGGKALICYEDGEWTERPCPYGEPGDRLWVRETWNRIACCKGQPVVFRADSDHGECPECDEDLRWRPSIFMPRALSRITLEIQTIRVAQLQDISEQDAKAEGISVASLQDESDSSSWWQFGPGVHQARTPVDSYRLGWNHLNAKRGFGWDTNPYVWVVEFRRIV